MKDNDVDSVDLKYVDCCFVCVNFCIFAYNLGLTNCSIQMILGLLTEGVIYFPLGGVGGVILTFFRMNKSPEQGLNLSGS